MMPVAKQRDLFTRRWRNVLASPQGETAFHIQLVSVLRWCIRPDVRWRHVPNGGWLKDKREGAKMRAMGILSGSADLEFHWIELDALHRKIRRVLHLELKAGNRPRSEAQVAFALAVRLLGDEYHVARSVDAAIVILGNLGLIRPGVEVCGRRW